MSYYLSVSGATLSINFNEILVTNRVYTITLSPYIQGIYNSGLYSLDDEYSFSFTSKYCPLFTTVGKVKLQGGPLVDTFLDDTILRMIHKNSLDAVDLFNMSTYSTISYDYWGCSWHDVPARLRTYVECKTAYDVLSILRVTQQMSGGAGDQLKSLGDMTIKYGGAGGNPSIDPKRLSELYNCWNEALRMFASNGAGLRATVKGYWDTSKGYSHPVRAVHENRIIRPVFPQQGNYTPGTPYIRGI
jgi:hypothetical protein